MRIRSTTVDRHAFPVDEWALVEVGEGQSSDPHDTLFAISNGVFGVRTPISAENVGASSTLIVNRFHETFDITYPEDAFGLARTGQSLVPGPDLSRVDIEIDEHRYPIDSAKWVRRLDFKTGSLERVFQLSLRSGATAVITQIAFVSQVTPHLAFHKWTVEVPDSHESHRVSITMHVRHIAGDDPPGDSDDPRQGRRFSGEDAPKCDLDTTQSGLVSRITTRRSQQQLTTELRSEATQCEASIDIATPINGHLTIYGVASPKQPFSASTVLSVSTSSVGSSSQQDHNDSTTIAGFDEAFEEHQRAIDEFWSRADISVDGDPAVQQLLRWHLFQLFQASPTIDRLGISAKGQTALGYDGHYFWDTEMFMLPFLAHIAPERAQRLLNIRHDMLPEARTRAATMSQKGALFPWRTLNGEEASAYYPAGTAQYHINADISWAVERYVSVNGDHDFASVAGTEIAVETARMWADFAFEDADGQWHLHGVTGPDEYSAVVDDNAYTNVMAAQNLRFAARMARATTHPSLHVSPNEINRWLHIAERLVIPFDGDRGIYAQDAHFLSRRRWELADIPEDQHPLLLHLHPLVIYRHQLIKQADVVLALLLAPDAFQQDALLETFRYYEDVTTGDSSLSAAIQAAAAATVGEMETANEHFDQALFLDLANTHGNTADGVHLANSGGIWNAIVIGMAGISFGVNGIKMAPTGWCIGDEMSMRLPLRSSLLELTIRKEGTTVHLHAGEPISLITQQGEVSVDKTPIFVPAVFPSAFQRG